MMAEATRLVHGGCDRSAAPSLRVSAEDRLDGIESQQLLKRVHGLDVDDRQLAVHVVVALARFLAQPAEDANIAFDPRAVFIHARIRKDHGRVARACRDRFTVVRNLMLHDRAVAAAKDDHFAFAFGRHVARVVGGHEDRAGMAPLLSRDSLAPEMGRHFAESSGWDRCRS
jgi:hypothetical protein